METFSTFRTSRCLGTPSLESHRCLKWVWRWKLLLGGRNSWCRRIFKSKKKNPNWVCQGLAMEKVKVMFSKWEQQPKSIHKVETGGTQEGMSWNGSPTQLGDSLLDYRTLWDLGNHSWTPKGREDICGKLKIKWAADTFSLMNVFFP